MKEKIKLQKPSQDSSCTSALSTNLDSTLMAEQTPLVDRSTMTLLQLSQTKSGIPSVRQERLREEQLIQKKFISKRKNSQNTKSPQKWSEAETKKFYKLVQIFGTDFQLMQQLHTQRTRKQIKNKFRKEERNNADQIKDSLNKHHRMRFMKLHSRLSILKNEHKKYLLEKKDQHEPQQNQKDRVFDSPNFGYFLRKRCDSFKSVDSMDLDLVTNFDVLVNQQT